MSCERIENELVAFHFGVVSPETRRELEAHLPGCAGCLASYLALKRDIETAELEPGPTPAARRRLRRAVAEELGLLPPRPRWSWWERPLALGIAGAAVAAALLLLGVLSPAAGWMPHALRQEQAQSQGR
jgi:anti-sigma factor RsiW